MCIIENIRILNGMTISIILFDKTRYALIVIEPKFLKFIFFFKKKELCVFWKTHFVPLRIVIQRNSVQQNKRMIVASLYE